MNVARLNFSHGSLAEHKEDINRIRSIAQTLNQSIAIMIDLPGPKIRIGKIENEPLILKKGDEVVFTTENARGTQNLIPVKYKELSQSVSPGGNIYLNDGFLQFKVLKVFKEEVKCKVVVGGELLSNKGMNLPGAKIFADAITKKDLDFVDFGLKNGVHIFAASFVKNADDINMIKNFAKRKNKKVYVIAKIERAEAVKNIDEIMKVADGIMIARGDLGVQVPIEQVPMIQKKLIRKANIYGQPVITATQMLESMTQNLRPTRAEVTDVANAIIDGTDAVMLSAETAIGKYPSHTVVMMSAIAATTERQFSHVLKFDMEQYFETGPGRKNASIEDIVSLSVFEATQAMKVKFIITTSAGSTASKISRFRPHSWILSFVADEKIREFLEFSYGVHPFYIAQKSKNLQDTIIALLKKHGLIKKGDKAVLTEGKASADSLGIIGFER